MGFNAGAASDEILARLAWRAQRTSSSIAATTRAIANNGSGSERAARVDVAAQRKISHSALGYIAA